MRPVQLACSYFHSSSVLLLCTTTTVLFFCSHPLPLQIVPKHSATESSKVIHRSNMDSTKREQSLRALHNMCSGPSALMMMSAAFMSQIIYIEGQNIPAIEASPIGITIKVPSGQSLLTQVLDGVSQPVQIIDQNTLNSRLSNAEAETELRIAQAITDVMYDIQRNFTTMQTSTDSAIRTAFNTLNTSQQNIQDEVSALFDAVRSLEMYIGLTNVTCGDYPSVTNGTVIGIGTRPGDARVVSCNPGYSLVNVTGTVHTVLCGVDGTWSDGAMTRCAVAPPPTPPPTTPSGPVVTCCIGLDNSLVDVWADGEQLRIEGRGGWNSIGIIRFPSSTRVLGIHGYDQECGCRCGHMVLSCSTNVTNATGPWEMYSPGVGNGRDLSTCGVSMLNKRRMLCNVCIHLQRQAAFLRKCVQPISLQFTSIVDGTCDEKAYAIHVFALAVL
eukprot:m.685410 g.685410  ORF g.685410 m.685410 type:complete len:442 (+) comp22839_c0_seq9:69-1394(+)